MATRAQEKYLIELMYRRGFQVRGRLTVAAYGSGLPYLPQPALTADSAVEGASVATWIRHTLTPAQASEIIDLCKAR